MIEPAAVVEAPKARVRKLPGAKKESQVFNLKSDSEAADKPFDFKAKGIPNKLKVSKIDLGEFSAIPEKPKEEDMKPEPTPAPKPVF